MLEESTITKAAEKAGISRDTAYKYLKNENFQAELNKRRTECISDTVRVLQSNLLSIQEIRKNTGETTVMMVEKQRRDIGINLKIVSYRRGIMAWF